MTSVQINIPSSLRSVVDEIIRREGMSFEQFAMLAIAEKASAIATEEYLEQRARQGNREKFLAAMSKVADVEPPDEKDRIQPAN